MRWVKGATKCLHLKKAASTVFTEGQLVNFDGSGYIIPADSTSGDHIGIVKQSVAATDDDYAQNTALMVEVPLDKFAVLEAEVTGTFAATAVGTRMDLSDADTVNADGSSKNVVTCVAYVSSTLGHFVLNSTFDVANVATT